MRECPDCHTKLPLPDTATENSIRCPTCHRVLAIPTAGDKSFPPIAFKARVRDPRNRLKGTVPARLTPTGLELGKGARRVELPIGTPAKYRGGNQLTANWESEQLELIVFKLFHYQNRLAHDAAELLNGERTSLRAKDYTLAWYLLLPAVLPLGIPIITLGGAIPAALGFGLAAAAGAVATRESWSTGLRVAVSLLFSLIGYAGLLAFMFLTGSLSLPGFSRIPDSQWQEFTPPDKQFHILMPGAPKSQIDNAATALGNVGLQSHSVTVRGNEYGIGYSDLPFGLDQQTPPDVLLNGTRDGILQPYQGKLTAEKNVSLSSLLGIYPGREFSFEMSKPKGKGAARIFLIRGRLYQLLVVGRWLNPGSDDVRKYFDSFTLDRDLETAILLQDHYSIVRGWLCATFAVTIPEPRPSGAPTLAALATICMDENMAKALAVKNLFRSDPQKREAMLALLRRFLKESPESRLFALRVLADLGPAAKPVATDLQELAQPSSPAEVRKAALDALQKIQAE